ncbi:unnamed protein product [Sphenostylis stenocarpa]|uniref:Uncharacterized protein n=1 Tax=Sphenostylis stenocarpa TaxID=92480 RepID=A0AA86W2J2_9FABA|nr:unnamed protein product [Sphenostylis stenocarpa]
MTYLDIKITNHNLSVGTDACKLIVKTVIYISCSFGGRKETINLKELGHSGNLTTGPNVGYSLLSPKALIEVLRKHSTVVDWLIQHFKSKAEVLPCVCLYVELESGLS